MAKSKKTVERARTARDSARAAVKKAEALAAELPKKRRKALAGIASDVKEAAAVSDKKLARHPKRSRRRLEQATARLDKRVTKAAKQGADAAGRPSAPAGAGAVAKADLAPAAAVAEVAAAPAAGAAAPAAQGATPPPSDLHSLTVFALRRKAKESGHRGFWSLTKTQLIDLLS